MAGGSNRWQGEFRRRNNRWRGEVPVSDIRGCDVFEFGVKQARPISGFTTEAFQDADTHPPYATRKRAALPRDPRRGTQGRHATQFAACKLEQICC